MTRTRPVIPLRPIRDILGAAGISLDDGALCASILISPYSVEIKTLDVDRDGRHYVRGDKVASTTRIYDLQSWEDYKKEMTP